MKKKLLFAAVILVVIVIAAGIAVVAFIDGIARNAIERGGTYALGAQTKVSGVSVGLLGGRFSMSGLNVANPAAAGAGNFNSDHFLSLGSGSMAVSLSTLRQATVELPRLTLADLDVSLEKKDGQTNYGVILDNLAKVTGKDKSKPASPSPNQKKFIIRDLDMQNIVVRVDLLGGPGAIGELTRVTVPIDRIKLSDVGKTGDGVRGTGVTMEELAAIIVKAVLAAAVEKGGGLIPGELLNDLKGRLVALGDIGNLKMEVVAAAAGKVEEIGKKAMDEGKKALEGVKDKAKKELDEAAEKLKGLIPGKR